MTKNNKHTARNVALGGAVLAGASYLAGILTAPKAGRQTRKDIKNAATKAKREAEAKLKKAHSELNETIDEMSKKGVELKGKAGEELKEALSKATTVKQKAREILSAIHEGEAQDKDLEVAINEVKKALKHLKTFAKRK